MIFSAGKPSQDLMEAVLSEMPREKCNKMFRRFSSTTLLAKGVIESQLCAASSNETNFVDACAGDICFVNIMCLKSHQYVHISQATLAVQYLTTEDMCIIS